MKKQIKNIIKNVVSFFSKLIYTSLWLLKMLLKEDFKNHITTQNKYNDKLAVLGNGPSLKNNINEIRQMQDTDFVVVNHISQDSLFEQIKPQNYVLADPLFFEEGHITSKEEKTLEAINNITWKMNLYIPYYARKSYKKYINNPLITVEFFHAIPFKGFKFIKKYIYNKGLSLPTPNNVLIPSLYVGITKGYKEIKLYGADFSWIKELCVTNRNIVCRSDAHFYEDSTSHIKPWTDSNGIPYTMYSILTTLADGFLSFYEIEEIAKGTNCKIYNMNPNSYIDCFEKLI